MSGSKHCPVCDRPPGDREETGKCHAWYLIARGYPMPSGNDIRECWGHAKGWRETAQRLELELADMKLKLAAAQRSLSRHHAAAQPIVERDIKPADMFPDNARIE